MSPRILIVEDEHALMELLRYNFEKSGYAVEVLGDGDQADARLKEAVPDVLLLDWVLPGLSAIEPCRRARQSLATKNLPIIMLTARGDELDKVRGFETGADNSCRPPAACSRGANCSTACGGTTSTWTSAPSTCTSADCARPCSGVGDPIRSGRCAAPATA